MCYCTSAVSPLVTLLASLNCKGNNLQCFVSAESIAELYKGFRVYRKRFTCFSHTKFKFYYLNSVSEQATQFWICGQAFKIHLTCLKWNIKEKQSLTKFLRKTKSNLFTTLFRRWFMLLKQIQCFSDLYDNSKSLTSVWQVKVSEHSFPQCLLK